jgi:hypothetical protein
MRLRDGVSLRFHRTSAPVLSAEGVPPTGRARPVGGDVTQQHRQPVATWTTMGRAIGTQWAAMGYLLSAALGAGGLV